MVISTSWFADRASIAYHGMPRVIDGDSVLLDGVEIRLIGIDAPEIGQICFKQGSEFDCGNVAKNHLENLIGNGRVKCDGWQTDRYDRLLANCSRDGLDLNGLMVKDGWAVAYGAYENEELIARNSNTGLWETRFVKPQDWRQNNQNEDAPDWLERIKFW